LLVLDALLDVGRDHHRANLVQLLIPYFFTPGEKLQNLARVGAAGVGVADGGGEEFEEALGRGLAGVGDDRRQDNRRMRYVHWHNLRTRPRCSRLIHNESLAPESQLCAS